MVFYNESDSVGIIIHGLTNNVTGSLFLTLLVIIIMLMVVAFMFRLPIETTSVLIIPLLIVVVAYSGEFLQVGGVFLIYMGILIARNLPFR